MRPDQLARPGLREGVGRLCPLDAVRCPVAGQERRSRRGEGVDCATAPEPLDVIEELRSQWSHAARSM
eukprot:scaffold14058_cov117-Isochrysis_galbana.AAC.5